MTLQHNLQDFRDLYNVASTFGSQGFDMVEGFATRVLLDLEAVGEAHIAIKELAQELNLLNVQAEWLPGHENVFHKNLAVLKDFV